MRRGDWCARVGANNVALAIDVLHAEGRIDGGLVGIGGRARQVVHREAREELILWRESCDRCAIENWSASVATFDAVA